MLLSASFLVLTMMVKMVRTGTRFALYLLWSCRWCRRWWSLFLLVHLTVVRMRSNIWRKDLGSTDWTGDLLLLWNAVGAYYGRCCTAIELLVMTRAASFHRLTTDLAGLHDALGWTSCQKGASLMMDHISISVWTYFARLLQVSQTLVLVLAQVT